MNIGATTIRLKSVPSTNDFLKEMTKDMDVKNGTVVISDFQTQGRGQMGNQWESEMGQNLTFSFYYTPINLDATDQFIIAKRVAIGITNALISLLQNKVDIKIKWPNDIYINSKKIGGILIENSLIGNVIESSIIGIGLNVNQETIHLNIKSISLKYITDEVWDIEGVFSTLKKELEIAMTEDAKNIEALYLNRLFLYQKNALYEDGDGEFLGIIEGIESQGELCIRNLGTNIVKKYRHKEVKFIF
jgi:BirA family transcriptional regulator, biotin operon repressor / biotin---[acetyl-CoA-carboxylase] ligase